MSAFWRGRRVLVTGHTGFKGSWLCLWLGALGARVSGFALAPPTRPSLFELARLGPGLQDLRGDVRDLAALRAAVRASAPEVILHLAAQPLVRLGLREPLATFAINAMGTLQLLEAVREAAEPRAVVLVTSDKCYAARPGGPRHREDDALGGADPYSASKACAELIAAALRGGAAPAAGARVATARAGNAIGGGDFAPDRLVPDLVRAFRAGRPALLRAPRSRRPWQHVLEPLAGYLRLAERLLEPGGERWAEPWNFGPHERDECSAGALADAFAQRWGAGAGWREESEAAAAGEAAVLRLDSAKAQARLGWSPRWSLARALDETALWYRAFARGEDLRRLCLAQLERYEADRAAPPRPQPAPPPGPDPAADPGARP